MLDVEDIALLGGHVALDFVNTIEDRDSPTPDDVLRAPEDLERWARRLEVGDSGGARQPTTPQEFARVIQLREDLHGVLRAVVHRDRVPPTALKRLDQAITEAYSARRLVPEKDALAWAFAPRSTDVIGHNLALAAGELLTNPTTLAHVRLCAADQCGWFYLDHSKNHSRRWCSMRGCGTRAKAKRRASKNANTAAPDVVTRAMS